MRIHKKIKHLFKGFTLVELIVVISVLAVLASIAMSQVSNITAWARDSQRMTDMSAMKSSIELYKAKTGKLPIPTNGSGVTYSGALLWTQGTFGEPTWRQLNSITPKPVDPTNAIEYVYSVANNNREFELGGILEKATSFNQKFERGHERNFVISKEDASLTEKSLLVSLYGFVQNFANDQTNSSDSTKTNNSTHHSERDFSLHKELVSLEMTDLGFDQTFAASQNVTFIEWTYNGVSLKVETGSKTYVVAAPSLIGGYLGDAKMENTGLTIEWLWSLPLGFSGTVVSTAQTGTFKPAIAWSGAKLPETSTGAEALVAGLQSAYTGTVATSLSQISSLVSATGSQITALGEGLVENALGGDITGQSSNGGGGGVSALNCSNPVVTTIAGNGTVDFLDSTNGTSARFYSPSGMAIDSFGNLYVSDMGNNRIRKIANDATHTVTTIAGGGIGFADGIGTAAKFYGPQGITIDEDGNLYVADTTNYRIRKIANDANRTVTTIAGNGTYGFLDGIGTAAKFYSPIGIWIDNWGNIYVGDLDNNRIRKIANDANRTVTTIAGNGTYGFLDGVGASAQFKAPTGIAVDSSGNLYIADQSSQRVRKIANDANRTVTTIAGNGSPAWLDGTGSLAQFYAPAGVTIDSAWNIFVAESSNHRIRKIANDANRTVTTIAGDGTSGYQDGAAMSSKFRDPQVISIDSVGNLYILDKGDCRIRKISCQ